MTGARALRLTSSRCAGRPGARMAVPTFHEWPDFSNPDDGAGWCRLNLPASCPLHHRPSQFDTGFEVPSEKWRIYRVLALSFTTLLPGDITAVSAAAIVSI